MHIQRILRSSVSTCALCYIFYCTCCECSCEPETIPEQRFERPDRLKKKKVFNTCQDSCCAKKNISSTEVPSTMENNSGLTFITELDDAQIPGDPNIFENYPETQESQPSKILDTGKELTTSETSPLALYNSDGLLNVNEDSKLSETEAPHNNLQMVLNNNIRTRKFIRKSEENENSSSESDNDSNVSSGHEKGFFNNDINPESGENIFKAEETLEKTQSICSDDQKYDDSRTNNLFKDKQHDLELYENENQDISEGRENDDQTGNDCGCDDGSCKNKKIPSGKDVNEDPDNNERNPAYKINIARTYQNYSSASNQSGNKHRCGSCCNHGPQTHTNKSSSSHKRYIHDSKLSDNEESTTYSSDDEESSESSEDEESEKVKPKSTWKSIVDFFREIFGL